MVAILGILRELYELEDLKMNIKFEVQVLCNNINFRIEDIPPTSTLARRELPGKEKNTDFNVKPGSVVPTTSPVQSSPTLAPQAAMTTLSPALTPLAAVSATSNGDSKSVVVATEPEVASVSADAELSGSEQFLIPNMMSHVVINPSLSIVSNPAYRRIVCVAVDRALREILPPVVERCTATACITMKHIVLKDFVMESNEMNLSTAAQRMSVNLAASLAIITCKEPLRISIGNHLRSLLTQVNIDAITLHIHLIS